ncbi:MAG: ParB/RepB/Spo0J family partition protein [Thermofilaceae archaeon]
MKVLCQFQEPVKNQTLTLASFYIDELSIPPFQRDLSKEARKLLEIAIDKLGFLTPIIVVPKNGKYYVVDGRHRLEALRELGVLKVIAIVVDESLYNNILDFNTQKPPNVKERAKQSYRLYVELLKENEIIKEIEVSRYFKEASLITLGFVIEEYNSKFPASFYDSVLEKFDTFLDLELKEAYHERRKRAEALLQLHEVVNQKYAELNLTNPLLKGEIIRKACKNVFGQRVRFFEGDYYEIIEKLKDACQQVTFIDTDSLNSL